MPAAMRTFLNKIGALLLAALLATAALPVGAHAAAKPTGTTTANLSE